LIDPAGRGELQAARVGQRRVRVRAADLDEFLAARTTGDTRSRRRRHAGGGDEADRHDDEEAALREKLGVTLQDAAEALDRNDADLAAALRELADAARKLAEAIGQR
jgi:hypothetical protein